MLSEIACKLVKFPELGKTGITLVSKVIPLITVVASRVKADCPPLCSKPPPFRPSNNCCFLLLIFL